MISAQVYQKRRARLCEQMRPGSIAIIPAAAEVIRNGDAHYRFRQDSDFYYVTGFNEPDALAVLIRGETDHQYILFNRERDPAQEIWTGKRAGQDGAVKQYLADESFSVAEIDQRLPELIANQQAVYFPMGHSSDFQTRLMTWLDATRAKVRQGVTCPSELRNIQDLIHEMRLFKSDDEIDLMRKAAQISVKAHQQAMTICQPGMHEYQLHAELMHVFFAGGCSAQAYDSIVGGGENSCVLHYIENDQPLNDGDLVLIDAGGEYQCYAADITRTFPVNGRFSEAQKAIYNLVLKAQLAAIEKIKPGLPWPELQRTIVEVITQGLVDLGLLQGELNTLIEEKAYFQFYMHNSGHWLGLDVHDAGTYKKDGQWRTLQPGMVLTVEPGIYIAGGNEKVDKKWWHIGVRIEDDVLVTDTGYEILSDGLAKTVEDIEALMQS